VRLLLAVGRPHSAIIRKGRKKETTKERGVLYMVDHLHTPFFEPFKY
jgi:hypothetical protein